LENWIGIHAAKCAVEGDVMTACEIIITRNTLLRQLNGAKMSVKFFNIGEGKICIEKKSINFIVSFIPLARAERDDSLSFSGAFIPPCYIPFLSTLFYQLVFHPPSLHFAIYFLVFSQLCCFQIHI